MVPSIMIVVSAITLLCTVHLYVYGAETQTQPGLNVVGSPTNNLQPWLHPVGVPGDLDIGKWLHDTPLLRSRWQTDAPPITSRQISKSWFGWKNISYMFSLYVSTSALRYPYKLTRLKVAIPTPAPISRLWDCSPMPRIPWVILRILERPLQTDPTISIT